MVETRIREPWILISNTGYKVCKERYIWHHSPFSLSGFIIFCIISFIWNYSRHNWCGVCSPLSKSKLWVGISNNCLDVFKENPGDAWSTFVTRACILHYYNYGIIELNYHRKRQKSCTQSKCFYFHLMKVKRKRLKRLPAVWSTLVATSGDPPEIAKIRTEFFSGLGVLGGVKWGIKDAKQTKRSPKNLRKLVI